MRYHSNLFQSTHPCGVRPHTDFQRFSLLCFNPRTRVGCDCSGTYHPIMRHRFNPRTRVGCDDKVVTCKRSIGNVSIHAPVWGATAANTTAYLSRCFNPRTRVGCDNVFSFHLCKLTFQSTHPCGVRRCRRSGCNRHHCFNPRTRVGCDVAIDNAGKTKKEVSIHAPVWGATKSKSCH